MAQRLHDRPRIDTLSEEECCRCVSQVVKSYGWELRCLSQRTVFAGRAARIYRQSKRCRKDKSRVFPRRTRGQAFCQLPRPVSFECDRNVADTRNEMKSYGLLICEPCHSCRPLRRRDLPQPARQWIPQTDEKLASSPVSEHQSNDPDVDGFGSKRRRSCQRRSSF